MCLHAWRGSVSALIVAWCPPAAYLLYVCCAILPAVPALPCLACLPACLPASEVTRVRISCPNQLDYGARLDRVGRTLSMHIGPLMAYLSAIRCWPRFPTLAQRECERAAVFGAVFLSGSASAAVFGAVFLSGLE